MLELLTILYSALPITELRGSIPLAISWGLNPVYVFFLAIIGNIIPIFILILGLNKITSWSEDHSEFLAKILNWIFKRTRIKTSKKIHKYGPLAIFLFVAIPIPGTGAWTGSIAAWLFGFQLKRAIIPIISGVVTAGIIVTLISIGLFSLFGL